MRESAPCRTRGEGGIFYISSIDFILTDLWHQQMPESVGRMNGNIFHTYSCYDRGVRTLLLCHFTEYFVNAPPA
jgi:hypothetical protein